MQEKYRDTNPVVGFVIRRFFERLARALGELDPASVLDAGCGEGELLRRGVLPRRARAVGLDVRLGALPRLSPIPLVCATVEALPFAAQSFDVALCLEVLEHLRDPAPAFRELARVARRAVVISVPHEPWFRAGNLLRGKYVRGWGNFPEHIQHWNHGTLRAFLAPLAGRVEIVEAMPWIIAICRP